VDAPGSTLHRVTPASASLASVDGEIVPAAEARVPATDEGLLRGDGVFEVIRLYGGRPFALEEHLLRLASSGANLRLGVDLDTIREEAERLLARAGPSSGDEVLRVVLTRGGRRLLLTEPLVPGVEGVRLTSITYCPTHVLDGVKSLSYAANMLAGRLAHERGFDEALLVTPHGRVLEAPTSSLFWVNDGAVLTPPLDEHILASITRAAVIELSGAVEKSCTLADLATADEAFLASTTREVQPVAAIDERTFPAESPVTSRIATELSAYIRSRLAAA